MKTYVPLRHLAILCALAAAPAGHAQSSGTFAYYAGLTYTGFVGSARSVQAVEALASGSQSWVTLTNFNLPFSPFLHIDPTSAGTSKRFYHPEPAGVSLRIYPGLSITGAVGSTNVVQFDDNGVWTTLETLVLAASPSVWVDTAAPAGTRRTYRVVDIGAPPSITSPGSRGAQTGYPFNYQITTVSIPPVTAYSAAGLPIGLSINPSSGLISGSPSSVGTNTVTLTATSENGTGMSTLVLQIRTSARPEMVAIPAGTFQMGSDPMEAGHNSDEGPVTTVTLTGGFSIGVYEVTQAEYRNLIGSTPSFFSGDFSLPVDRITYGEATNYCALLTARDRGLGVITASQAYRLPTEAEWEYAARAGTTNRFSFGDSDTSLGAHGWYLANAGETTHVVGEKAANPWGLFDAHGNCWEWCSDYHGSYPGGSVSNPQGPGSGSARILRGGSWFRGPDDCRSANRDFADPAAQFADVSFRVVLAPVP